MTLARRIADTLRLAGPARTLLESLYERQPATERQLAERSRLTPVELQAGLRELRRRGMVRGTQYLWLDLAPALQAIEEGRTDIAALMPSAGNEVAA
jgi:predicted transcriptional regulator